MQLRVTQTRANFSAEYQIKLNDEIYYEAKIPLNFKGRKVEFIKNNDVEYILSFNQLENMKNLGKSYIKQNIMPFYILDKNENVLGHIYQKRTRSFFGYLYFEMVFENRVYEIYEIGLGKQGIKVPIFCEGIQIGLIEKDKVVYDNMDYYDIISKDDFSAIISSLFCLYYDFVRFGHYAEVAYKTKKTYLLYSTNKELKGKYNADFKKIFALLPFIFLIK